ncbi:hypothetical protein LZK73_23715 [Neorhizobium galegae]|nr:hypothetical protein LZK73_23715 [Neorhizobium galegae]
MTIASDISRQLAGLVAFPTVSAVSNLDLIKHVEAQTAPFGGVSGALPIPRATRRTC